MTDKNLYKIACADDSPRLGHDKVYIMVLADSMLDAVYAAPNHPSVDRLWDEAAQRKMAMGKEYHHRDYQGLVEEVEYVDA